MAGIAAVSLLAGCGTNNGEQSETVSAVGQEQEESSAAEEQSRDINPEDVAENLERAENPGFEKEDIRGISVVVDGEPVYQMNYTPQEDKESYLYWSMLTPYPSTVIVNTETMYQLYETIAGLDLTSGTEEQADASQTPESFDTYITLNYFDGGEDESEAEPNKTVTLLIGDEQDGQYYCVLKGDEEKALLLNAAALNAILQYNPYDLILKIPYVVNVVTVGEVDISYKGKDYTMTLDGGVYKINGKEVDSDEYLNLYSELMQPMLDGEIPEDAGLEEGREPLISMRYVRNMEGAKDYEVDIYTYGDNQYTVSVNGVEKFFLSAEDVEALEKVLKDAF